MSASSLGAPAPVVHLPHKVELPIIFYQGQPVITFAMMDKAHRWPEGTARRNFNSNKDKLITGEDYFVLEQPNEIRTVGLARSDGSTPASVILLTDTGYLMLVKSFTDDLAWQVQRELVKNYFRVKQDIPPGQLEDAFRNARWLAHYQDGEIRFESIHPQAFFITPESYIDILRQPNIFSASCLPDVLAACAKRLEAIVEDGRTAA